MRSVAVFASLLALALCALSLEGATAAHGPDMGISKTRTSGALVNPGDVIQYNISVFSVGHAPANTFTVTDAVPANTTFESFSGGCCGAVPTTPPVGGTGNVSVTVNGPHAVGAGTSWTLRVRVNCNVPANTVITNTASISSAGDVTPGNDQSSATALVSGTPSVNCGGVLPPAPPPPGGATDFLPGVDRVTVQFFVGKEHPKASQPATAACTDPAVVFSTVHNEEWKRLCTFLDKLAARGVLDGTTACQPDETPRSTLIDGWYQELLGRLGTNGCSPCAPAANDQVIRSLFADLLKRDPGNMGLSGERALCYNPGSFHSIVAANALCGSNQAASLDFLKGAFGVAPNTAWGPSVHFFDGPASLGNCLKVSKLGLPLINEQIEPLQNRDAPFLQKLFCGETFDSSTLGQVNFNFLSPHLQGSIVNLNLGTTGAVEGAIGSYCYTAPATSATVPVDCATFYDALLDRNAGAGTHFDPDCAALTVIPQVVTVTNQGQATGDVKVDIVATSYSQLLHAYLVEQQEGVRVTYSELLNNTILSQGNSTQAITQSTALATAAQAVVTPASTASSRGISVTVSGLAPGQTQHFLVFAALALPTTGAALPVYTVNVSSPQDTNPANNSTTLVANANIVLGTGGGGALKPVAPQIFQNPGAIAIVQQRPRPTPTPRR
jgi:uncharacterized repeat protein (TIGR01451 family)